MRRRIWDKKYLQLYAKIARRVLPNGCMKSKLEEKSAVFRFLDRVIGKKVNKLRDSLLSEQKLAEAKHHAKEAMGQKPQRK